MLTHEQIEDRFKYHSLDEEQIRAISTIREVTTGLAVILNERCPSSREKSLALTKLEECAMWANKAIAMQKTED